MYSYTYDPETGGLLLNASPAPFSREPRPVYAPELDLLGFDRFWRYDRQTDAPYMWAEANQYFYRGRLVARLKGGNAFTAPEIIIPEEENGQPVRPEPDGGKLRPVDLAAMVAANRELLEILERTTVRRIVDAYARHRKRLDCFHVAFSGGKDSCVLLDLVKKALPKGSFVVVFGDTGMEFPDTYEVVRQTQAQCQAEEIPFYIARSHFKPEESWQLFGPPSRVLRWCCSVHKSAPQTLKLREITGKTDYTGLAFVGVRAHESATRAKYEYENFGKKQRGQYSNNPILEWTSAEIWLYIYINNIIINNAYKIGSARVGCLCCPMGGGKSCYIEYKNYTEEIKLFHTIIEKFNSRKNINLSDIISKGMWSARKNGRDLLGNQNKYLETRKESYIQVDIINTIQIFNEWNKTLNTEHNTINVKENKNGFSVKFNNYIISNNPFLSKSIHFLLHKSAYCVGCKVCEANCTTGAIKFVNNTITINNCIHCKKCYEIDSGCLLYHSLRFPSGGGGNMKSINTLSNHAPKSEWLNDLFEKGHIFFDEHGLGPEQISFFKRFLKDAEIIINNETTNLFDITKKNQWDSTSSLGIILINLVNNNPQICWYVVNFELNKIYQRQEAEELLSLFNVKPPVAKTICGAFKRITDTQFGSILNFGHVNDKKEITRTKCALDDPRVLLYGLFKFAEKCNNYKEFTLATLLNDSIERDGVSPTRIFGLTREEALPLLLGLSAKYPEFISATFTHDLEKIALAEDKSSQDVLALFA